MLRKILKILAVVLTLVCALGAGLVAYASHAAERTLDVPVPAVVADRTPAGSARGAAIFHATCEACHRASGSERASGAAMKDAPAWLGAFYSGNITRDPAAGIGALSDGLAARMLRFGVNRARHWAPMPAYAMSDADLAAVLGFLRSDDPLFAPEPQPAPRSRLTLAGKTVLFLSGAFTPPVRRATGIVAPPRAPDVAYGRYLAESVYMCGDCHTPGFDADKSRGPDAYAGGAELMNAAGEVVYSPNLTKHEAAGIGRWNRDQFAHALRDGLRPDGAALGYPMPRFRGADDVEVDALLAFLRSFPAKSTQVAGQQQALAAATASKSSVADASAQPSSPNAEQLFTTLGCASCHGKGRPYAGRLAAAASKPTADVARWIRNPEAFLPGTIMPTFAPVLDEASALELARWLQHRGTSRESGTEPTAERSRYERY